MTVTERDADLEALLAITTPTSDEQTRTVENNADTMFTWNYGKGERAKLDEMHERAKTSQWNGSDLLDAGDGWLRDRYTEMGIIQFEDRVDTAGEYGDLDEVAKDRSVGAA